jgi:hypothetical protein
MLSSRTIKFLAVATLIVVAVFATVSMVGIPANENTQNAGVVVDLDSENSIPLRQPDPFDALKHDGPGR